MKSNQTNMVHWYRGRDREKEEEGAVEEEGEELD